MGFLAEIVGETQRLLRDPQYTRGLPAERARPPVSLRSALERDASSGAVLVEYKRVSPGRPDPILPPRTVGDFVSLTEGAGVTGYSCLATGPRFHGAPADVAELVRSTRRPVLFKEFVIDPRQLDAAARTGAGAVLLIARLETERYLKVPLRELSRRAHELDLEVVLEFHARSELSARNGVEADVFGVNVRNLDSLAIDRPTGEATLEATRRAGLHPLIGLSGIESRADAERFWSRGVDGILVGSAVARSSDPAALLTTLRRSPPRGGR
jgi:indole-3-glycerol phosphate synthase